MSSTILFIPGVETVDEPKGLLFSVALRCHPATSPTAGFSIRPCPEEGRQCDKKTRVHFLPLPWSVRCWEAQTKGDCYLQEKLERWEVSLLRFSKLLNTTQQGGEKIYKQLGCWTVILANNTKTWLIHLGINGDVMMLWTSQNIQQSLIGFQQIA